MNMRQRIRLTESHLHNLIKESIRQVLNEISINDKYNKETQNGKNTLPFDTFQQLCELDPTTTLNRVGKYANWILQKYNQNANFESLRVALEWYADGVKRNILQRYGINSDINSFKSYEELIDTMNNIMQKDEDTQMSNSEYDKRQVLNGQFKVLGSCSTYDIIQPLTYDAEYHFGSTTEWCTVANEDEFNNYMKSGPLFILYPKDRDHKKKMQFHFETQSFADWEDYVLPNPMDCMESVVKDENELNELCQLCQKVWSNHKKMFIPFEERLANAKQQLANGEDPEDIFDSVGPFYNGFATIELNNKWNFLNQSLEIISENWYDNIYAFCNGFAMVEKYYGGYNFINEKGELKFDEWFVYASCFDDGFCEVHLQGRGWNFINENCELISDEWFYNVGSFHEGFARVCRKGEGWNFINEKGEIKFEQWFECVLDFEDGFAKVYIGDKWYKLDVNGVLYDKNTGEPVRLTQESKMQRVIKGITMNVLNEIYNKKK